MKWYQAPMKTIKSLSCLLSLALITHAFSLGAQEVQPLQKLLTCKRMNSIMFGQFQQGDELYSDIYLDQSGKLSLVVENDYGDKVVNVTAAQNLRTGLHIENSMISAEWQSENKVQLVLAYFGGVNWSGMITFPAGWEAERFSAVAGEELEITCREINFQGL